MAHNLARSLARLDEEANRYAGAAKNLSEAAKATQDLVKEVQVVGDNAAKAINTVASVGGPEIVQRLAALETKEVERTSKLMDKIGLATILAGAAALLALSALIVGLLK